jgi:hypothetical protein
MQNRSGEMEAEGSEAEKEACKAEKLFRTGKPENIPIEWKAGKER